jgi:hypothetical protein
VLHAREVVQAMKLSHLANYISKLYRGVKVRRRYKKLRIRFLATLLARTEKTRQAQITLQALKRDRECLVFIQLFWKRRFGKISKKMSLVQARWRGIKGREQFFQCKLHDERTRTFQHTVRGFLARKRVHHLLELAYTT